jgi:hypothetical protein
MSNSLTMDQLPAMDHTARAGIIFAGFWRRFVAWIIDWAIVSTCASIVFLLLAGATLELARALP